MKTLINTFLILTMGILFTACGDNEPTSPINISSQLTSQESRALKEADGFGKKFFNTAVTVNPDGNLLVSPFGAQVMLGMLANATDEASAKEIISVLAAEDLSTLNSALAKLSSAIPVADRATTVTSVNSLWYSDKETLLESFRSELGKTYGSVFYSANFADPEGTRQKINTWTKEKTKGLIPELLNYGEVENLDAVLINALYFNGKWSNPFNASDTESAVFHGAKTDSKIQMMNKKFDTTVSYYDNCRIVRVPFGSNIFYINLILPDEGIKCNEAILSRGTSQDKFVNLSLSLPRFEIKTESKMNVTEIYAALGCKKLAETAKLNIFEGASTLSARTYQKATLKLTEEGVEASAGTYTGGINAAPPTSGSDTMIFDRPFAFTIGETSTGIILFAGRVTDL